MLSSFWQEKKKIAAIQGNKKVVLPSLISVASICFHFRPSHKTLQQNDDNSALEQKKCRLNLFFRFYFFVSVSKCLTSYAALVKIDGVENGDKLNKDKILQYLKDYRQRHTHRTLKSFRWAIRGIYYTFLTQKNFKFQLVLALAVVVLMFTYPLSWAQRQRLLNAIVLVLAGEMMNTAIEYLVDLYEKKFSRQAMMAKDIAAGAVLLVAVHALIQGVIIFGPFVWQTVVNWLP